MKLHKNEIKALAYIGECPKSTAAQVGLGIGLSNDLARQKLNNLVKKGLAKTNIAKAGKKNLRTYHYSSIELATEKKEVKANIGIHNMSLRAFKYEH